jgi:ketosteroid isomerase-like protein
LTASGGARSDREIMSSENVKVVSDIYDGFILRGSIDTLFASLHPDVVVHEARSLPFGGTFHGIEGVKDLFGQMFATWDDLRIAVEKVIDGGDELVVAILRLTGRAKATGTPVDMQMTELWTLRDGKVIALKPFYWDAGEIGRITKAGAK